MPISMQKSARYCLKGIISARFSLATSFRARAVRCVALLLAVCVLASFPLSVFAKQKKKISRTVTGVVLDGTDNPIAGASVELTDVQTAKKVAIYSEDGGRYQFADLNPAHDYELLALNKNISSDVRKVSSLDDRDRIVVILRIPPSKE
jgi:Carboxypeptidase regulatory-like domain